MTQPLTLRYTLVEASDNFVDNPPAAASQQDGSAGDLDTFTDRVLSGRRPAGRDGGVCTLVTRAQAHCNVTLVLFGRGTIEFQALVSFTSRITRVAVVGGTGQFAGRRGSAELRDISAKRSSITIRLL